MSRILLWRIILLIGGLSPALTSAQSYTAADSLKIFALLDSADVVGEMEVSMRLAKQALAISQKCGMVRGIGWANLKIAFLKVEHTPNADVQDLWDTGIRVARQLNDGFMLGIARVQQGKYMMYNNRLEEADHFYKKALEDHFEKEASKYTAVIYNDIGNLAGRRGERKTEAEWYLKSMKLAEQHEDLHGWANSAGNLAITFFRMGNRDDALRYAKEALGIHKKNKNVAGQATVAGNLSTMFSSYLELDSAIVYRMIALDMARINGQKKHLIQGHLNLGVLLDKQGRYAEALAEITKSIDISRETSDWPGLVSKTLTAAGIAGRMKDDALAEEYFLRAYTMADSLGNKELLRDFHSSRMRYYQERKNFENAFQSATRYHALKDSLIDLEARENVSELQLKYESERKDFEIERLKTDQKIRELELERQRAVSAGDKLMVQRKEDEIRLLNQQQLLRQAELDRQQQLYQEELLKAANREQQLLLAGQKLEIADKDRQLKDRQIQRQQLLQRVGLGVGALLITLAWVLFNRYQLRKKLREKETLLAVRSHISQDLHDEIGSSLTNVSILNELTKRNLTLNAVQAADYLHQSGESIQRISEHLSEIVWNINPRYDDLENLLVKMKRYAADMLEGAGVLYDIAFPDQVAGISLPMDRRRDFYLLFKEAINNLVKYAQATHVSVSIELSRDKLKLQIRDNGVGFVEEEVTRGDGLTNMKHRAALLGGQFRIVTAVGEGTLVELTLTV